MMNLFQIIFINVILLIFPILIYLIYLSTDKNITKKEQKLYLIMTLYASFYLLYKFDFNNRIVDLILLTSIIILFLLEDMWRMGIIFTIVSLFAYMEFNNIHILLLSMPIILMIYYLKLKRKISKFIFIESYIIVINVTFLMWILIFNKKYLNLELFLLLFFNSFVIIGFVRFNNSSFFCKYKEISSSALSIFIIVN